jgi:hypothetical protein
MSPGTLGPKSSAAQLWAALQQERARHAAKPSGADQADLLENQARLFASDVRASAREEALLKELAAARDEARSLGVAGERVAGKPAVADFRRTWERFAGAVLRLPDTRRQEGMKGVRLVVASDLLADLYLLSLGPPRGVTEARERDRLRRVLETPSFLAVLSRDEPWADRLRVLFLSQVARTYFRPSVWRAYEEASSDVPAADKWGTVYK